MVKTFHNLFYVKKPKNYGKGLAPIYLRISVDGKRTEVSTGRETDPDNDWISDAGRVKNHGEKNKQLNKYLDSLQSKLYDAYQALIREDRIITVETLKNKYTGVYRDNHYKFL
ncbi:MAG: hypothetical protein E6H09_02175 [Bacteroidetes bacterium]|jgi:hypothetical protein|nr:MAG: hypothetical protein E6H09_02175 [Bacteroidota bacterium]